MANLLPEHAMVNLKHRATGKEIMDDFSLPETEVVPVLKGLEKMNSLFGGHKTIIKALKKLGIKNKWHVSDWGCGGGDSLRAIAKWAKYSNLNMALTGVDATPAAITFARTAAVDFADISFILTDVMSGELTENQFDVVYSSLFSHHFDDDEWVALVKKMISCSKKAVIITDLHRHWLLYYAVTLITRIFTTNKMARFDGPLSVKRSFKRAELVDLLNKCGVVNYKIGWKWAFRWEIVMIKKK